MLAASEDSEAVLTFCIDAAGTTQQPYSSEAHGPNHSANLQDAFA